MESISSMKMVFARLAGAVMASSLNKTNFGQGTVAMEGLSPPPLPGIKRAPSLEWLGRLTHVVLCTVVKEKSAGGPPERNRGLSLGCHQGIRAGPYSVAPIDALKRWRASVV